jgi:hypothetical protein
MGTYADLAGIIDEAAKKKVDYANDLKITAAGFVRELERAWEAQGKVELGHLSDEGEFIPGEIGKLNTQQIAAFVINVRFDGDADTVLRLIMQIARTKHGVSLITPSGERLAVDADQPASFAATVKNLSNWAFDWALDRREKSALA